jgi:hypothetical protein
MGQRDELVSPLRREIIRLSMGREIAQNRQSCNGLLGLRRNQLIAPGEVSKLPNASAPILSLNTVRLKKLPKGRLDLAERFDDCCGGGDFGDFIQPPRRAPDSSFGDGRGSAEVGLDLGDPLLPFELEWPSAKPPSAPFESAGDWRSEQNRDDEDGHRPRNGRNKFESGHDEHRPV